MLSDVIPAYEAEDFGPPLSAWEKSDAALTDKFREEFPDGVVPVRHLPKMGGRTSNPVKWAFRLLAAFDAAKGAVRSVDECARLREEFLITFGHHYDGYDVAARMDRLQARNNAVRGLIRQGLTIRQVARYLQATPEFIGRILFNGSGDAPFPERTFDMDEVVLEWFNAGKPIRMADLARQYDTDRYEIRRFVRLREETHE